MASLKRRLTIATVVALTASLGLTALALDSAFQASGRALVEDRLRANIYAILTAADETDDGRIAVLESPPDPRLLTPGSGLYARVLAGNAKPAWNSPSMLGETVVFNAPGAQAEMSFDHARHADGSPMFGASLLIAWDMSDGSRVPVTVQIAEDQTAYNAQLDSFRQRLLTWFSAAALLTIAAQIVVLAWGMRPLQLAADAVADIRAGKRERLDEQYVAELRPLTTSLNRLIDANGQRLKRHRDALGNLAHTLKTPLAVIRTAIATAPDDLRDNIDAQVTRMDDAVAYHLKRASAAGGRVLGESVDIHAKAQSVALALRKVYADKQLTINVDEVSEAARFHGDDGDLMEILGNLLDNASKWAATAVHVSCQTDADDVLVLSVVDDGPGIRADELARVVERGARADPDTPGHGIGLAIVHQLVCDVYGGSLEFTASEHGSGLHVTVTLPGHPAMA